MQTCLWIHAGTSKIEILNKYLYQEKLLKNANMFSMRPKLLLGQIQGCNTHKTNQRLVDKCYFSPQLKEEASGRMRCPLEATNKI